MAISLDMEDHTKLAELVARMLDWHEAGELSKAGVIGLLDYFIGCVATDNEDEVRAWLADATVAEKWKDGVTGAQKPRG